VLGCGSETAEEATRRCTSRSRSACGCLLTSAGFACHAVPERRRGGTEVFRWAVALQSPDRSRRPVL